jgi:hypothetical protein
MNPRDIICTALTPGSPFNPKDKIFRSVNTLAAFCSMEPGEVLELLAGDLAPEVVCKPSPKKGVLVALRAQLPPAQDGDGPQVVAVGGPALNPPAPGAPENPPNEAEEEEPDIEDEDHPEDGPAPQNYI